MKKLLDITTKIVKALDDAGIAFTSNDNCEDELSYNDIEGHTVVVGDDHERRTWSVDLRFVGASATALDVINHALGKGTDSGRKDTVVLNWEPKKKVTVVASCDGVEVYQTYTKR